MKIRQSKRKSLYCLKTIESMVLYGFTIESMGILKSGASCGMPDRQPYLTLKSLVALPASAVRSGSNAKMMVQPLVLMLPSTLSSDSCSLWSSRVHDSAEHCGSIMRTNDSGYCPKILIDPIRGRDYSKYFRRHFCANNIDLRAWRRISLQGHSTVRQSHRHISTRTSQTWTSVQGLS